MSRGKGSSRRAAKPAERSPPLTVEHNPPGAAEGSPGRAVAPARSSQTRTASAADPAPRAGALRRPFTIFDLGTAADAGAQAHYADPDFYTHAYRDRRHDIDYYVKLARRAGGPVLEYGVGNGRIALHIARAGIEVTGVDLSRAMLDDFQERLLREPKDVQRRITLHEGDMRTLRLHRRFRLAIAPFNAFLHLYSRSDVEAFLAGVHGHLAPGGRLVFDVSVPQPEDLARSPEQPYPAPDLVDPETGEPIGYSETFEYDPLRQLLLVRARFAPADPERAFEVPLTHRQFFPREVEALLHYNGFEEVLFTADFTDQPADRHVDSMVVSCRPRHDTGP